MQDKYFQMNLKLRLNIIITALLLLIMLVGATFTIKNARKNIQAEISSTSILALHMLEAELVSLKSADIVISVDTPIFKLQTLENIRHLKIDFFDINNVLKDSNRGDINQEKGTPPTWFIDAMDTVTGKLPITRLAVVIANNRLGTLVVTPDVLYEITEEWEETKGMLLLLIIFFLVVNILVYFAVSIALRPIDNIIAALTDLESGNLSARLPKCTLPELSSISDKFNVMAKTLQSSIENNHSLTQKLIRLQEDERKNLAQELHDEIGQHLTAIHIDASAIKTAKNVDAAQESASAIDAVVRRMMEIVHTMLQRLRPADLDELGLDAALKELTSTWLERQPNTHLDLEISGDFLNIDETVLISVYRLVQECLTNIARYADAKQVVISVIKENSNITMSIRDDGNGFDSNLKPNGFGLAGMKERVEGLAGKFELKTALNQGVNIMIELPCSDKGLE